MKLIFKTFLKELTLAATAQALNAEGVKIPRRIRGGGSARAKVVTFATVYRILNNKAYLGVRVFKTKAGLEEVPAMWPPIIDQDSFERVQNILRENCSRRKTHNNKFPFTLTGLLRCKECGERMSGASATSGGGKRIGYYEHLATKKAEANITQKLLKHKPRRIPAEKIEPFVWSEVKKFILDESFAKDLLTRARALQGLTDKESKAKDLESKRLTLSRQVALLAERIGKLPETIDPKPLFDQLGELQEAQTKANKDLLEISEQTDPDARPVSFESLEVFRLGLRDLVMRGENDPEMRSRVIKIIVHKIEIMVDGFEIHFHVGQAHYETASEALASGASFFVPFTDGVRNRQAPKGVLFDLKNSRKFVGVKRSTRLTNGGSGENRTPTSLRTLDFESSASTNSTTEPFFLCEEKKVISKQVPLLTQEENSKYFAIFSFELEICLSLLQVKK